MAVEFEYHDDRIANITTLLNANGIASIEKAKEICDQAEMDVISTVRGIQRICFDDACWAYVVGAALAIQRGDPEVTTVARSIGEGLQSFCLKGTVAAERKVGLGHGNLAAMVLSEEVKCFAFLAGHESFAASEGALGIAKSANRARKTPLRVILNGLGKDAANIIARVNGFTYVRTQFDYATSTVAVVAETPYSTGERAAVRCYGGNEMREGVAIMELEDVDVSISGNGTSMCKYAHPVGGAYKKLARDKGKAYFACASGGGIGRTLNVDDLQAGPASYGFTDMISRMYADTMFAGSSSVPAHVEMMGYIGMGNNPMVGATVSMAVMVSEYLRARS
jgi:hypothetical protein